MKNVLKFALLMLLLFWINYQGRAQGSDLYSKGIRININEDGSKYIRFISWLQFWTRYIENNPGTFVNGEPKNTYFDAGIRRGRFLWYAQISPKFLILTHIGINNQTFVNGGGSGVANGAAPGGYGPGKKPQIFIHDMWTEYAVVKNKLTIGTGLHYWNGISRLASASTLNFLALDAPIFNWPLIEESDQFARQFGIYAKGKLGKLDYRVSVNRPFATPARELDPNATATTPSIPVGRAISINNDNWALAGYFSFEFLEKESNLLPFFVGTYIGSKKVFNIGGGYHFHKHATGSLDTDGTTLKKHNMLLLGLDTFLDMPLNKDKGTAITAYANLLRYDFGPNYIRSLGIMNEGVNSPVGGFLPQGAGNLQYTVGTGTIFYAEAGYLLPKNWFGKAGKLQPFGTFTYKDFEFLGQSTFQYGAGFNFFIEGHHAKISLKYLNRPLYGLPQTNGDKFRLNPEKKYAGELVIQTQVYL